MMQQQKGEAAGDGVLCIHPGLMAVATGGGQMQLQKRAYFQKIHQSHEMQQKTSKCQ